MIGSAIVTGSFGIIASFFPKEILDGIGITSKDELATLLIQITGALYLGFAVMNWMAKTVLIGGIYARPLCMGNCLHFMVAGLALLKAGFHNTSLVIWVPAILYCILAVLFAIVLFTSPRKVLVNA